MNGLALATTLLFVAIFAEADNVLTSDLYSSTKENRNSSFHEGERLHVRKRRYVNDKIKINFINKSGREVRVFEVVMFIFAMVKPQFDLRPNEPKALEVSRGTVWEVRDIETGYYMLTNGRKRFQIIGSNKKGFVDLRIRRPAYLERKLQGFHPVSEKYLRIMLIADQSFTNYYGKKGGKKLLMTILSSVSKIFQDKSLGIKVNVVVTRIIMIEKDPSALKVVSNDPDTSITNVCSFTSDLGRVNGITNHNFAVVITRKSIGPSGYAAMYTMCTPKSCTLVKENGFNTAYVIAHEAGHALGIDHDGEDGECNEDKLRGSIMAPRVFSKHEKYHWSFCSKRSLYENIRYFGCLNHKPRGNENNLVDKFYDLPGEIFPKSSQCKVKLGRSASACYVYYGACEFLWCKRTQLSGCTALALTSPLEGTSCGPRKWCIKGKCVDKKKESAPVNGNWGMWTAFGKCKGLCGAGIKTRTRRCNNPPPQGGGKFCRGRKIDVEACKLQDCWLGNVKSRSIGKKCKTFGDDWSEFSKDMETENLGKAGIACNFENGPCGWGNDATNKQKWLRLEGPTKSSRTGPSADHTSGRRGGYYVYFEASWVTRSFKPVEGTSSKLASNAFLASTVCFSFYYHMFGQHIGALKLYKKTVGNDLQLLWRKEGPQGNQWFRGEVTVESEQEYQLVFEAVRGRGYRSDIAIDDIDIRIGSCKNQKPPKEDDACLMKCRSSDSKKLKKISQENGFPCYSDDSFDVCYQEKCLSVGCDYKINSRKKIDVCGICEGTGKSCKNVDAKKTIEAIDTFNEAYVIPEGSEVVEIKMKRHQKIFPGIYIDNSNATNVFNTDGNRWPIGNYTIDNNLFVYAETDSTVVIQIPKLSNSGCRVLIYNPFAKGRFHFAPKMNIKIKAKLPLTLNYDQFEYSVRSWTNCSKDCDGGIQKSILECHEKASGRALPELYCSDIIGFTKTQLTRACNLQPCVERFSWKLGSWSACSATCGISWKARRVKCLDRVANRIVENENCKTPRPTEMSQCFAGTCSEHSFFTEPWGKCNTNCGQGYQHRKVGCSLKNLTSEGKQLLTCPGEFPVTIKPCSSNSCITYRWVVSYLSNCSVSCGGGIRIRSYSCRDTKTGNVVFESLCPRPKPSTIVPCNFSDC